MADQDFFSMIITFLIDEGFKLELWQRNGFVYMKIGQDLFESSNIQGLGEKVLSNAISQTYTRIDGGE